MEHIYPAFERGRIMKKELLRALRDYSYLMRKARYYKMSGLHFPDYGRRKGRVFLDRILCQSEIPPDREGSFVRLCQVCNGIRVG